MRSVEQLRQWWLEEVPNIFARPDMWAAGGRDFESVALGRVRDLCYLDDRDDAFTTVEQARRGFGKLGVIGPFEAIFGKERRYAAEVASVYAEHFYRPGYLAVDRVLDPDEWAPLRSLREWTDTQRAIAAQLRELEARDPSQGRRR